MAGRRIASSFGIMTWKNRIFKLDPATRETPLSAQPADRSTHGRLVEAASCLERLELERTLRRDPSLGRLIEERIICRELLELELQEIDEQIGRISDESRSGLG
jgi:hypothetical protein